MNRASEFTEDQIGTVILALQHAVYKSRAIIRCKAATCECCPKDAAIVEAKAAEALALFGEGYEV